MLNKLISGGSLSEDESEIMMGLIMDGKVSPAQIGALLIAMRLKGESVEEIAGFARVMRDRAVQIQSKHSVLVDTCGTGGDGVNTFNISTAAALVTAGCGVPVAKHGNRSVSSQCGSADVLEALGVSIDLEPYDVGICLDQLGIAFLFAPQLHGALKHASEPRREIGVRTIFNLLGPLANPARANNQVLGVFNKELVPKIAGVLSRLGTEKSYVLNGALNTDEVTPIGPALVYEVTKEGIRGFELDPLIFGIERCDLTDLRGGSPADNGLIIRELLSGKKGPHRNAVILNTSLALMASGFAQDMSSGLEMAADSIDSGKAAKKLQELVDFTSSINSRREAI
ncbi:MAG: anthranilate phosphoribosyltransferase [Peptococcaceae bacterium]|nr:anthranilate phosphoribosyltransferase [Peptococcaceae bacterium]